MLHRPTGVSEDSRLCWPPVGEERLIQLLKGNIDFGSADLQRKVIKTVSEFGYGVFHDDMTVAPMTSDKQ